MSQKALIPCFVDPRLVRGHIAQIIDMLQRYYADLKRADLHIVVLVPSMDVGEYPDYHIRPHVLTEMSFGHDKSKWKHDYQDIARCKALQLWTDRTDGSQIQPHLLFRGDAPFYGGVKREDIVVACSGVQPYFDRMIAGMIADMLIGFARYAWETSDDKKNGVDNLT